MLRATATSLTSLLRRWIPDPFVFAILLTLAVCGAGLGGDRQQRRAGPRRLVPWLLDPARVRDADGAGAGHRLRHRAVADRQPRHRPAGGEDRQPARGLPGGSPRRAAADPGELGLGGPDRGAGARAGAAGARRRLRLPDRLRLHLELVLGLRAVELDSAAAQHRRQLPHRDRPAGLHHPGGRDAGQRPQPGLSGRLHGGGAAADAGDPAARPRGSANRRAGGRRRRGPGAERRRGGRGHPASRGRASPTA